MKRHSKDVVDKDRYYRLLNGMRDASTELIYLSNKEEFDNLIETVTSAPSQKSLLAFIRYWDERKFRWALAYRMQSTCDIPRNSLAEDAHAKMKSGGRKNLSLVDAAYEDTQASACFEARWQKRKDGEKSTGRGPTGKNKNIMIMIIMIC